MAGCVEGIRRELVLGLVLITGTAIEQAPSVGPHHMVGVTHNQPPVFLLPSVVVVYPLP